MAALVAKRMHGIMTFSVSVTLFDEFNFNMPSSAPMCVFPRDFDLS